MAGAVGVFAALAITVGIYVVLGLAVVWIVGWFGVSLAAWQGAVIAFVIGLLFGGSR